MSLDEGSNVNISDFGVLDDEGDLSRDEVFFVLENEFREVVKDLHNFMGFNVVLQSEVVKQTNKAGDFACQNTTT